MMDPFLQASLDSKKALATFLPSLIPKPPAPPPMPPPKVSPQIQEGIRVASLARHVEMTSKRVARGLSPVPPPPPSPQETFGPELDPVHIRALQAAIASHPETQRAVLLHEASDMISKWVMSMNGKVVIDGHIEIAGSPEQAEKLAAKIVNEAVDSHDDREQEKQDALANPDGAGGDGDSAGSKAGGSSNSGGRRPVGDAPADGGAGANAVVPTDQPGPAGNSIPPVGSIDPATQRPITQTSTDLDTAQDAATAAAPELKATLGQVEDQVPGAEVEGIRDEKDPERAQQKVDADGKPVETQTDLLAGRIAVDSPEAKDAAVDQLKQSAPVIDEEDNFNQGDPDYGFRSHTLQLASKDGTTSAEVQVVPKEIADADEKTHDTYEEGRDAEASGDTATAQAAMDTNRAAHDGAMEQFNQRNADRPTRIVKALTDAGFKVRGNPIKIGGHSFVPVVDDAEET